MKRRKFIQHTGVTVCSATFGFPFINTNKNKLFPFSNSEYSSRTVKLVQESLVVDMLNQFRMDDKRNNWLDNPGTFLPYASQYRDSGIDVFALGHGSTNKETSVNYFKKWNKLIFGNPELLHRIDGFQDLRFVSKTNKIGVLLSLQDSNHFESLEDVDLFYSQGQRISQLTYNWDNKIGSGAFNDMDNGLTDYGSQIVSKMNEVGMAIDLSHCSDETTIEALELSSKPVLITHSTCRSLNPGYVRAKTDEIIKKLAAQGGLFGIAPIRFMIRGSEPVTIEHWLEHFDHLMKLVGPEYIGIGSDMDLLGDQSPSAKELLKFFYTDTTGRFSKWKLHTTEDWITGVEGINHPKRTFDMVEAFINHGYSDRTIKLILGENFLRFAKSVWK